MRRKHATKACQDPIRANRVLTKVLTPFLASFLAPPPEAREPLFRNDLLGGPFQQMGEPSGSREPPIANKRPETLPPSGTDVYYKNQWLLASRS